MLQPEGFVEKGNERLVWRLKHALYGLKQAALAWWKELEVSMKQIGFICLHSDAGIFIHTCCEVLCITYVDDYIFAGKDLSMIMKIKQQFMKKWECRDLGEAKEFLKMRIRREGHKIILDQQDYLDKIVMHFNLQNHTLLEHLFLLDMNQKKTKEQQPHNSVRNISPLLDHYCI